MIFRRPDAFIIKHIRFIHAIVLLCLGYLLLRTSDISKLYAYVASTKSIVGESHVDKLFNFYMYLLLFISLFLMMVVMLMLIKRKKKFIFYLILNITLFASLVFYIMSRGNIITMQKNNVAAPVYLAYGDISDILFYAQGVLEILLLVKTTGFDIKTFSFGKKVSDFDLTEEDSEEIEFNLEIDGNEIKTKRRRKIRDLKYYYFENKFKINLIIFLLISISIVLIRMEIKSSIPVYYKTGTELNSYNYNVVVKDVYLSNEDYNGKVIEKNSVFLILTLKLKKNIEQEYAFDNSYISVSVNGKKYFDSPKYFEYFSDFGVAYKEQKLTQEYNDYYLVYKVPYEFSTEDIFINVASNFDYSTNKYNYYEVKTNYKRISDNDDIKETTMHNEMNIETYGIKNKVIINEFDFQPKYKIKINNQINGKNYELVEYITPTADDNEDKAIMRLEYEETYVDQNNKVNFSSILSKYATIEYEINGSKKEGKIYSFISPKLLKEDGIQYIQVSKDVLEGTNHVIKIKIRDHVFKYKLD